MSLKVTPRWLQTRRGRLESCEPHDAPLPGAAGVSAGPGAKSLRCGLGQLSRKPDHRRVVNRVAGNATCFLSEAGLNVDMREIVILTWMRHMGRQLGAIALLALLVRAILPAGYMVASADTPSGRVIVLELCSGDGSLRQTLNLDTGEQLDLHAPSKSDTPER